MRRIFLLLLVIGITGSLGSVSYFSDKENVNGDLRLILGTLSSEATKTVKIEKMDVEVPVSDTFIITNNGTLDQRMTLNFKNSSIGNDGLEKIKYSLSLKVVKIEIYKGMEMGKRHYFHYLIKIFNY